MDGDAMVIPYTENAIQELKDSTKLLQPKDGNALIEVAILIFASSVYNMLCTRTNRKGNEKFD